MVLCSMRHLQQRGLCPPLRLPLEGCATHDGLVNGPWQCPSTAIVSGGQFVMTRFAERKLYNPINSLRRSRPLLAGRIAFTDTGGNWTLVRQGLSGGARSGGPSTWRPRGGRIYLSIQFFTNASWFRNTLAASQSNGAVWLGFPFSLGDRPAAKPAVRRVA